MKLILEYDKYSDKMDIIVTIPKSIKWTDYEKELKKAEEGEIMNFKVSNFPRTGPGCKCYLLHDGFIKGWMKISGMSEKEFTCTTTGKPWKGKFIERTGPFYKMEKEIAMKGFMGFKYMTI